MVGSEPHEEGAGVVLTVGEAAESSQCLGKGPRASEDLQPGLPDPHCPAEGVGGGQHDLRRQSGRPGGTPGQGHFWPVHSFSTKSCTCPSPVTQRGLEGLLSRPAVSGANRTPSPSPSAAGKPARVLGQRRQDGQVLAGRHRRARAHVHGPQTQRERPQVPRGHL